MPSLDISKSIQIKAPVSLVFEKLNNFNHWQAWSPWLIQDPKTKVSVAEDTKFYRWEGDLTGEGQMQITDEVDNKAIDYDLIFLKPWKSKAKVRFELAEEGEHTKVTWLMNSSLPFFLFFMKKTMTALIGMDYERGLSMLKDYIEKGDVPSTLEFLGQSEFPGCSYIGIRTRCTQSDIGPRMEQDLTRLGVYVREHDGLQSGQPFSIYHKFDMVKGDVEYTSGIPVTELPATLPEGMITGSLPATPVYTLRHKGAYRHLGNAWSTLYNMQQRKKFKKSKATHPFETYINSPMEVGEEELITDIRFAVR